MRIFIIFLAVLAVWCCAASIYCFNNGEEFWGWVNAACVVFNLGHMSVWVHALGEE